MSEKVSGTARHNDSDTFRGARGRDHPTRLFPVRLVVGAAVFPTARRPGVRGMAIDTPLGSPMEEPAMILNRWYRGSDSNGEKTNVIFNQGSDRREKGTR